jgi:hypothetical protein
MSLNAGMGNGADMIDDGLKRVSRLKMAIDKEEESVVRRRTIKFEF